MGRMRWPFATNGCEGRQRADTLLLPFVLWKEVRRGGGGESVLLLLPAHQRGYENVCGTCVPASAAVFVGLDVSTVWQLCVGVPQSSTPWSCSLPSHCRAVSGSIMAGGRGSCCSLYHRRGAMCSNLTLSVLLMFFFGVKVRRIGWGLNHWIHGGGKGKRGGGGNPSPLLR